MLIERKLELNKIKNEFRLWSQTISADLILPDNVKSICFYGFTEIINNAIDHSEGSTVLIRCEQDEYNTEFIIQDDGVGIFEKLKKHFNFESNIDALIDLVKGKLTSTPNGHSGEGLFFSSKLFDKFIIASGDLLVTFEENKCEVRKIEHQTGTQLTMQIANNSHRISSEVFSQFTSPETMDFCKTRFFISLSAIEMDPISRAQAKQIVARLEDFIVVELDFSNVKEIGQGFADELLRVWPINNPNTRLTITNANESVLFMVHHVMRRNDLPQPLHRAEIKSCYPINTKTDAECAVNPPSP